MDMSNDSPGQESIIAADSSGDKTERASKRIRLNLACNQCRKRKVRCDAETPKASYRLERDTTFCSRRVFDQFAISLTQVTVSGSAKSFGARFASMLW